MYKMTVNILKEFWSYLEKEDTKISDRVLNWLDKDQLGAIVINDKNNPTLYWLETTNRNSTIPKYIFNYIKRYMDNKGIEYLYDKYPAK